jgi:hypothetical protein
LPLAGLFLLERYVDELADPHAFKLLFDQLVARRGDSYFDWYQACAKEFLDQLRSSCRASGSNSPPWTS